MSILSYVTLAALQFGISCGADWRELKAAIKTTWRALLLGIVGQWLVMPASAFAMAHAFSLQPYHAVALILIGCCPGGTLSNAFTYLARGDLPLSLSITLVSNTLAVGTLPLFLYLWTLGLQQGVEVQVAFGELAASMTIVILPTFAGLWVRSKSKRWGKIGENVGMWLSVVVIGSSMVAGLASNAKTLGDTDLLPWTTWVSAFCTGIIGAACGFIVPCVFRLKPASRNALVFEFMMQNVPLATAVVNISFKHLSPAMLFSVQLFPIICEFPRAAN